MHCIVVWFYSILPFELFRFRNTVKQRRVSGYKRSEASLHAFVILPLSASESTNCSYIRKQSTSWMKVVEVAVDVITITAR